MSPIQFRSWIKSLTEKWTKGSRSRRYRSPAIARNQVTKVRPRLEALEDRVTPATITPSTAPLLVTATSLVIQGSGFDANNLAGDVLYFETGNVSGTVTAATTKSLTVSLTDLSSVTPGTPLDVAAEIDDSSYVGSTEVAVIAPPGVTITPSNAPLLYTATSLTIAGSGFDPTPANDSVTFDHGVTGSVTAATTSALTVSLTGLASVSNGTALDASATADGSTSFGGLVQVATVLGPSLTPSNANLAYNATTLTIAGAFFDPTASNDNVTFSNGVTGSVTAATTTALTVSLTGLASVSNGTALDASATTDGTSTGSMVQVATVIDPSITSSNANILYTATSLTIAGSLFDTNAANDKVTFSNGVTGSVTAATATALTVSLTGLANLPSGTVLDASATIDGINAGSLVPVATVLGPSITSSNANLAFSATSMTIAGYAFDADAAHDKVTFSNGVTGSVTAATFTTLTVNLTGVTNLPNGTALDASATVDGISTGNMVQVATVTDPSITPSNVSILYTATSLTIAGSYFDTNTANDKVTFNNGVTGSVTAATSTTLTVSLTGVSNLANGTALAASAMVDGVSTGGMVQVATVAVPIVVTDSNGAIGSGSASDVTLPWAVANTPSGDIITFASTVTAITLSGTLTIGDNISIIGLGAANLTVSGNGNVVFQINSGVTASISSLTITDGVGAGNGGGVINDGTLTLAYDSITNNTANNNGGGVFNNSSAVLFMSNCTLTGNVASGSTGGGVMNFGTMTLSNSTVANNTGTWGGGVADASFGSGPALATVTDCLITNNSTTAQNSGGGGVDVLEGTVTLSNDTITNNHAWSGGGVNDNGGVLILTDDTITDNTAQQGGGISLVNYFGTILTLQASNTTISGNTALSSGGGVYNSSGGTVTLSADTISGNSASKQGGGVSNSATLTLSSDTISGNTAAGGGGGIFNNNELTATNTTVYGNVTTSNSGGGIQQNGGSLYLTNSTIYGNKVTNPQGGTGGGINVASGTLTLSNVLIAGNTAANGTDLDSASGASVVANTSLIGSESGYTFTSGSGNVLGVDPLVANSLANNGGSTQTLALQSTSPAIASGGTITTVSQPIGLTDNTISVQNATAIAQPGSGYSIPITIGGEEMLVTGVDQVYYLNTGNATGGTFTLNVGGDTTGSQAYNDSASALQSAIAALSDVGAGNVSVSLSGDDYAITFVKGYAVTMSSSLTGGTAATLSGNTLTVTRAYSGTPASYSGGVGVILGTDQRGQTVSIADIGAYNYPIAGELVVTDPNGAAGSGSATDVTLPWAIANVPVGDYITFASSLSGDTITLNSTLTISNSITILGLGETSLFLSGNNAVQVFDVTSSGSLNVLNLTIENGAGHTGGGIANAGTLSLTGDAITGNTAVGNGGGIASTGTLTLVSDTITNNQGASGGGIYNAGILSLTDGAISGNIATANSKGNGIADTGFDGNPLTISSFSSGSIADNITGAAGVTLDGSGIFTVSGNVNLGSGNLTDATTGQDTISGVISGGASSALNKTGTGTLTLSNTNTYSGSTTISAGTLIAAANGAMGPAGGPGITVDSGAALGFAGGITYANAEPLTVAGSGPDGNGALVNISGTNTLAIPVTFSADAAIGSDTGTLTVSGNVSLGSHNITLAGPGNTTITGVIGGTAVNNLTKTGSGTATLSAANTYTGTTTIDAGLLVVTASGATGPSTDPAVIIDAAGALGFAGGVTYSQSLAVTGSGTLAASIVNVSGNNTYAAPITLSSTLVIGSDAGTLTLTDNINMGAYSVIFAGAGNVVVTGMISGTATSAQGIENGLIGQYFNISNPGLSLISPAAASNAAWLGNQTPAVTAQLIGPLDFPNIASNGFADSVGDPAYYNIPGNNNNVEGRWYGYVLVPGSGSTPVPIDFGINHDDGVALYIDGTQEFATTGCCETTTALVSLTPGLHAIEVDYYQGNGGADVDLEWDPTGGSNLVDIPFADLYTFVPTDDTLTKTGPGTLTLANTNTYVGGTEINGGTLVVTSNGATGPSTAGIDVFGTGALGFAGNIDYTNTEPITIAGSGPDGDGAIVNVSGNNTFASAVTLTGAATIGSRAGTLTVAASISAGAFNITVAGPGNTVIEDTISSTGNVTLTGSGTITVSGDIDLGATGNLVASGSGEATVTGIINGTATSAVGIDHGLVGQYFNIAAAQDLIGPANASNSAWLGNQTPAVTAELVGPLDFPNISSNGFADSVGDPAYYDISGNNNNVEGRWYGYILVPGTGSTPVPINFSINHDDGAALYIDGNQLIDVGCCADNPGTTDLVDLTPGYHAIDVEYYQGGGGAYMDLQWDPTGGTNFVDIPNSVFYTSVPINTVSVTGTGTLTLSNTSNDYLGSTVISSGTLIAAANGVMGPVTAAGIVVDGGSLAFTGGIDYTWGEPVTISGTGANGNGAIENISGNNTFAAPLTVNGAASVGTDVSGDTLTITSALTLTGETLTVVGAGTTDLTGAESVAGGGITMAGAGIANVTNTITVTGIATLGDTGTGPLLVSGNVNLGATGDLDVDGSGSTTISGVISGTATTGFSAPHGLTGTYFDINNTSTGDGPALVNPTNPAWLGNQTPVATATLTGPIDFQNIQENGFEDTLGTTYYDDTSGGNQNVEARWYGYIDIPNNGIAGNPISFGTGSDDGSVVYIDGVEVINNANYQGVGAYPTMEVTKTVDLSPGFHTIDVEYFQGNGGAAMWLEWDPAGGGFVDVPNSVLYINPPVNAVTQAGSGTLTLSNSHNSYLGTTTISSGTLIATANGVTGPVTAAGIVVDGGSLGFTGGIDYTWGEPVTISGTGANGNGAIENISDNNTFAAPLTVKGAASVGTDVSGDTLTISSALTLTGDTLTVVGAGTTDLTGAESVASGGGITMAGAGIANVTNTVTVGTGTGILGDNGSGPLLVSGNVDLGANGDLDVDGSGNTTISGIISGTAIGGQGVINGLTGEYFNISNPGLSTISASNSAWLGNQTPVVTATLLGPLDFPNIASNGFLDTENNQYYNLGNGNNNNVEGRWYGELLVPGTVGGPAISINFGINHDDGVALYIDGTQEFATTGCCVTTTALVSLTPGLHAIEVDYYQGNGGADVDLEWDTTGGTNFVDIPNSDFFTTAPANNVTKSGTGTLTLDHANTYTGTTTVTLGVLNLGNDAATNTGTVILQQTNPVAVPNPVAEWNADSLTGADGSSVTAWTDSVGGVVASPESSTNGLDATAGQNADPPTLVTDSSAFNGHNAVAFNGVDEDLLVPASGNPNDGSTAFTVAVVFNATAGGTGGASQWYENAGLVDAEQPNTTNDWGLSWSSTDQVAAGIGNGDTTLYSGAEALNTTYVAIYTWNAGTDEITLDVNGTTYTAAANATQARNTFQILFGRENDGVDQWFNGEIADIQFFNSALSSAQVNLLGVDLATTYGVTTTFAVTTGPATLNFAAGVTSPVLGGLSGNGNIALTTAASEPVTLNVGSNGSNTTYAGVLSGSGSLVKQGSGTLTLDSAQTYAGSTTVSAGDLQLGNLLAHRWSFNNSLVDSVGGSTATLFGDASVGSAEATITGNGSAGVNYISLGTNILPTTNSPVTIEMWVTENQVESWSRILDFGSTAGGPSNLLWSFTQGTSNPSVVSPDGDNQNASTFNLGTEYHIALVLTPSGAGASTVTWYQMDLAGNLLNTGSVTLNWNVSELDQLNMWLGRSEYGDDDANASYNEVRIWDTALTEAQLVALDLAGPDASLNPVNILPSTTTVSVASGATLDLNGANQQIVALSNSGGGGGSVINSSSEPATLTLAPSGSTATFGGVIGGGSGSGSISVVMNGTGTQILTGVNTYTGTTTISSGTLEVNGSLSASSAITVSGGTLSGVGTVGPVTVTGGSVNPGSPTGTLSATSATFSTNGNLTADITGTTNSLLSVTNSLTLGGTSTLSLNLAGLTTAPSGPITIATDGSETGAFAGLYVFNNPNDFQVAVGYTATAVTVTITSTAHPTAIIEADTGTNPSGLGANATFTVTVTSASPISGETVSIEDASNGDAVVATPTLTNGTATFSISSLSVGSHNLFAVYTTDGTYGTSYSNVVTQVVVPAPPGLAVTSVTATPSGFVLLFNEPIDPKSLVLYSSPGDTTLGAADISIVGATTGTLRGSVIIDPTNPDELTFVQTSGLLAPDTYTVGVTTKVTSDGTGMSSNYSTTFSVASTSTPVLSVPSFARGPGQTVALTDTVGNETGIPVNISNATGVTQVSFSLTYDPQLLTIAGSGALSLSSAASSAGLVIQSYTITPVDANHSILTVSISGGTGFTATIATSLATILASVPTTAPYLDKEVLNLSSVQVNGASATGVSSVAVVAYPGDVLGTGLPNATDASLVDQVASGSGTGFSVFKDLDPAIIGGVGGGLLLNANDASLIDEAASGATVAQIPSIPVGVSLTFGGPDPYLYLSAVQGAPGQTVTETLYLDVTDPNGIQLTALDEAIGFDVGALQISDVRGTSALAGLGSYDTASTVDNGSGEFLVAQAFMGTGLPPVIPYGTDIPVLEFNVTLNADMSVGSESGLTLLQYGTVNNVTQYTAISDNEGALSWTPGKAPSNSGNTAIDGSVMAIASPAPAVVETAETSQASSVAVTSRAIEPVRRVIPVSSTLVGRTGSVDVLSGGQAAPLIALEAATPAVEIPAATVSSLVSSSVAFVQPDAGVVSAPVSASAGVTSEFVQITSVAPTTTRSLDSGAALSLAVQGVNKAASVAPTVTSNAKVSTSVLDELYRQLGSLMSAPSVTGYNLGLTGEDTSDELSTLWDLDGLLADNSEE